MVSITPQEDALDLPATEDADDTVGLHGDAPIELAMLEDDEADPYDDAYADDVPLDIAIALTDETTPAVGDDSVGIEEGLPEDALGFNERGESLLVDGRPDDAMGFDGDEELGFDEPPIDHEDGGIEGIEDPGGERVDELAFPPLDGDDEGDDEELDVGISLDS